MLLELAYKKRLELLNEYKELGSVINPLVLVQLPNDDQARKETLDKSKLEIVRDFLRIRVLAKKTLQYGYLKKKRILKK